MSKPPRGLSAAESALWARVAATVVPLEPNPPRARLGEGDRSPQASGGGAPPSAAAPLPPPRDKLGEDRRPRPTPPTLTRHGLDGSWERKLAQARIEPDFTLDLHGHTLDAAHARLDHGLTLASAQGARLVLVIAGKPRPVDAADRGQRRGAIRAKLIDWLAAGPHAGKIAAVRPAHQRHGGAGAVYVVLRRPR